MKIPHQWQFLYSLIKGSSEQFSRSSELTLHGMFLIFIWYTLGLHYDCLRFESTGNTTNYRNSICIVGCFRIRRTLYFSLLEKIWINIHKMKTEGTCFICWVFHQTVFYITNKKATLRIFCEFLVIITWTIIPKWRNILGEFKQDYKVQQLTIIIIKQTAIQTINLPLRT